MFTPSHQIKIWSSAYIGMSAIVITHFLCFNDSLHRFTYKQSEYVTMGINLWYFLSLNHQWAQIKMINGIIHSAVYK